MSNEPINNSLTLTLRNIIVDPHIQTTLMVVRKEDTCRNLCLSVKTSLNHVNYLRTMLNEYC